MPDFQEKRPFVGGLYYDSICGPTVQPGLEGTRKKKLAILADGDSTATLVI
jgi:hypothetical protein